MLDPQKRNIGIKNWQQKHWIESGFVQNLVNFVQCYKTHGPHSFTEYLAYRNLNVWIIYPLLTFLASQVNEKAVWQHKSFTLKLIN